MTKRYHSFKSGLMLAVSMLFLCAFTNSPVSEPMQTVTVTLNVDTGRIEKTKTSSYCSFGQPEGVSNEDFTIDVNVGTTVVWQGVSSSAPGTDVVNITSINYRGGKNVFERNVLRGNNEKPERVFGKVVAATPPGQECKYSISFTVTSNGAKRGGTFIIDPKIQSH